MTATTTPRVHTIGTILPSWWNDRPASCQRCDAEIANTERYCARCWRTTERCPSCHGFGAHYRMAGGAPESEHCTRCHNTGRVARKEAA